MSAGSRIDGPGRSAQGPVATDQLNGRARIRIEDRSNDSLDISSGSAETEVVVDSRLNAIGKTGMERLVQRACIFSAHAIGNRLPLNLFR
jgi:hypothetical protein